MYLRIDWGRHRPENNAGMSPTHWPPKLISLKPARMGIYPIHENKNDTRGAATDQNWK